MRKFFTLYSSRINRLSTIIVIYCIILLSTFFNLQIFNNKQIKKIVHEKGWKSKKVYGERGEISDINNESLAISISKYSFWVNTYNELDKEKIVDLFSKTFNKPKEYYIQKLNEKSRYTKLEKNVLYLDCKTILDELDLIKGLRFEKEKRRFYPYNNIASHALGYVDLDGGGVGGIEGNLNTILSGDTSTIRLRKGIKGRFHKSIDDIELNNFNGSDITLTIDIKIQKILQEEINKIVLLSGAETANGLIIEPFTGDIVAITSFPDFNPNSYFEYDMENFKNRAISDSYEPGSTFKIIPIAIALESEKYSMQHEIYCENGKFLLPNKRFLRDHESYGNLSIMDVFAHSSNIGISKLIDNFENIELYKYCKSFGFGAKTGLPLKGEASGMIRDLEYWSKTSKNYISIGQELSITNIQLALAYCSIANGGYLLKPNIIKEISNQNEVIYKRSVQPIRKVMQKQTSQKILDAMKKVVSYGTAGNMNLAGYKIAGKTGTAQKYIGDGYSASKFISSFAAIFPYDNPEYVIIVSIDSPKYGYHWSNESAVPATREIIKNIIINTKQKKQNTYTTILAKNNISKINLNSNNYLIEKNEHGNKHANDFKVPNLKGKTLKEALNIAKNKELKLDPNKLIGKVIWQSLNPGDSFQKNEICRIKLSI